MNKCEINTKMRLFESKYIEEETMIDYNSQIRDMDDVRGWLLNVKESSDIELKKANELPKSFWETYSSFANTTGGIIILGVEEGNPYNKIVGVKNVSKTITSLWDQLNNSNKVSYKCISNEDVIKYKMEQNKTVILVIIREVPNAKKPVYINNKIDNTWIRTGDGDRKANRDELSALLRNAEPSEDTMIIDDFGIDDLDTDSILSFKERVNKRYPKKRFIEMNNKEFLVNIGGAVESRHGEALKIKKGALLFFGKINSIKEIYSHYHVDYFNRKGSSNRWIDRISDDEPSDYEMNLYNFFNIVHEKLSLSLKETFELDENNIRTPNVDFDETIRECLVNTIAHADYDMGYPSTKIEVYDGWFNFVNPGKMLVPKEQFVKGGDSRPRNELIMKFFRLLGASERQGFGGSLIYKTAMSNQFRSPELTTDLEHTELKVWNIDLIDSYPGLSEDEKIVLRYMQKNAPDKSIREMAQILGLTEYKTRKAIFSLEEKYHIIKKVGKGRATRYVIEMNRAEMLTFLQIAVDKIKSQC